MTADAYQKLDVWKRSVDLTVLVYELCKKLPKEELYAFCDQMKRAAVSIPSIVRRVYAVDTSAILKECAIISRMLLALIKSLRNKDV